MLLLPYEMPCLCSVSQHRKIPILIYSWVQHRKLNFCISSNEYHWSGLWNGKIITLLFNTELHRKLYVTAFSGLFSLQRQDAQGWFSFPMEEKTRFFHGYLILFLNVYWVAWKKILNCCHHCVNNFSCIISLSDTSQDLWFWLRHAFRDAHVISNRIFLWMWST